MTTLQDALTPTVLRYGEQYGITSYLALALDLIQQHFPDARAVHAEVFEDPESDDSAVAVLVAVPAPVEEIIARDDAYTDQWVTQVPWPAVHRIRLLAHTA